MHVWFVLQVAVLQSSPLMPHVVPPRRLALPMVAQTPKLETGKQHSPAPHEPNGRPGKHGMPKPPSGNGGSPPSRPPVEQVPEDVSQEPEAQPMHAAPAEPWPHCVAVCAERGMQAPDIESQQPVEQFCAVHVGGRGRQVPP